MSLFNKRKDKKVPEVLPDLISDGFENNVEEVSKDHISPKTIEDNFEKREPFSPEKEINSFLKENETKLHSKIGKDHPIKDVTSSMKDEKSFFEDLQKNISEEITDLGKLESWYKNKFLSRDLVGDMRSYWENQKVDSILGLLGERFKEKISEKTERLRSLERDWQEIYFELIEKEELIKEEEHELKKMLKEFVEVCKRRKKEKIQNEKKE